MNKIINQFKEVIQIQIQGTRVQKAKKFKKDAKRVIKLINDIVNKDENEVESETEFKAEDADAMLKPEVAEPANSPVVDTAETEETTGKQPSETSEMPCTRTDPHKCKCGDKEFPLFIDGESVQMLTKKFNSEEI